MMSSPSESIKNGLNTAREHLEQAYEQLKKLVDELDPMHKPIFRHIAIAKDLISAEIEELDRKVFDASARARAKAVLSQVLECIKEVDAYGES